MSDPFGTGADVHFASDADDWRKVVADKEDADDEVIETPEEVRAVLGFDPASGEEA